MHSGSYDKIGVSGSRSRSSTKSSLESKAVALGRRSNLRFEQFLPEMRSHFRTNYHKYLEKVASMGHKELQIRLDAHKHCPVPDKIRKELEKLRRLEEEPPEFPIRSTALDPRLLLRWDQRKFSFHVSTDLGPMSKPHWSLSHWSLSHWSLSTILVEQDLWTCRTEHHLWRDYPSSRHLLSMLDLRLVLHHCYNMLPAGSADCLMKAVT